jgi:hypothetical protein
MVAITYHDDGPWGSGVHRDIVPSEIDGSFFYLDQKIDTLSIGTPISIASFFVSGGSFYVTLTDGTQRGPFALPTASEHFRGPWNPSTAYAPDDIITNAGATYQVLFAHTSASTFIAGANDGMGHDYYGLRSPAPVGVPVGGTTGQALTKLSNADYAVHWSNTGVPLGGTSGQVLAKQSGTDLDTTWETLPASVPSGGLTRQALIKNSNTSGDYSWLYQPFAQLGFVVTGAYTLALSDAWTVVQGEGGTITIPLNASVAFAIGTVIIIINSDAGNTTIVGAGGVLVEPSEYPDFVLEDFRSTAFLTKIGTDIWLITGQLRPVLDTAAHSGTVTIDFSAIDILEQTPTADTTYNNASVQRKRVTLIFTTSGVTSFNITFGTSFVSQGVLATGTISGKRFVVEFQGDGTNYYEVCRTAAM